MGTPQSPPLVKLIVGMLSARPEVFDAAERLLVDTYGPVDLRSDEFAFDFTDYYEGEMGVNLRRRFVSHEHLIDPGHLPSIKQHANALEAEFGHGTGDALTRAINLDPGYVDQAKLVLATTKDFAHRLYLSQGIYAEVTLRFRNGQFEPWEWTYPDYRTEGCRVFFGKVRRRYREQLRVTAA
ncbi:MAG: DUF4416 family protein [Armatimonadetes bacterium]|nr:DUF4416 family protein [Armatimonadota bacterium]